VSQSKGLPTSNRERSSFFFDLLLYFSYNTFGVCFANSKLFAVQERLEIVSDAASPPAFLAVGCVAPQVRWVRINSIILHKQNGKDAIFLFLGRVKSFN
jgi:hypothetical protein